ncbi:SMC-Scp complex subunit ScpB [Rubrobacter marinus]|uniref:SMC-Scp complex subunit ScpB n=1 Tax=Rubrobacter marinus TaxID=2653852 RepID=A0A6G8PXP0_9ACTN|nr:SMC-Scp complex subunit ScpB [Rubrobacter marinus]QIN78897.1 SMC-Scp complex subunit ScpB [Rubrobacter marinus]
MTGNARYEAPPEHLIEAVLLSSPSPIALPDLLSATGLAQGEALAALEHLRARFSPASSGIVLREVAGGYALATNPTCAAAVERFRAEARPAPLSGAAHEVLASVLYLGPMTRAAVSAARGVNSDAVVRNLLERNLLEERGRDEGLPGSPALLGVTDDFLAAAGARDPEDFPPLDALVDEAELARVRERISGARPDAAGEA